MVDLVGAAAAATATISQSLELIRRVTTTIDLYKNGNENLEYLCNDLRSTTDIIELVQALEPLRTKGVLMALTNMLKHAQKLDKHINGVKEKSSTGSSLRRMAHQFMNGPEELEATNKMVAELTTLKATLILQIQVAHVGLSVDGSQGGQNGPNGTHVLDTFVLHQVNQIVEQRLGKGKGLKIAEVLQGKEPDEDGMIRLTKEEYKCLVLQPLGEYEASSERCTIQIANNKADDDALQVNGPVDTEVTHDHTIEHNRALGRSTQINGSMGGDAFAKALESKKTVIQNQPTSNSGQRRQPRPMPQQPAKRPSQALPYLPMPNGVAKRPKPVINAVQGALPGLKQVAIAEKHVSVVVSQMRQDVDDRMLGCLDGTSCNQDERLS
ncbi:hypothetical protein CEP53_012894 [Fusarium sp. AF-6]|nr:hypothetical protein CEP53_012894 [Fusarium sp. AF-6]